MIILDDADDRVLIREALADTLVVEAAAGTGKTTELVARIVQLIAHGKAQINEIAAVTFTEKAAGELKLRIREELEKARVTPATPRVGQGFSAADKPVPKLLEDALAHLEEAHVSTIHGFCADLLRERPVEARVDPGFEVLTEPQAERLFDRAFREWFQRQLESPSEGVRRALRRLPSAWSPYADDEDGPVERLRRAGKELLQWRDLRAPWRREQFDRDGDVKRCVDELCTFADLTAQASWSGDPLLTTTASFRILAADLRRASDRGAPPSEPVVERKREGAPSPQPPAPSREDLDRVEALLIRSSKDFRDIRTGKKADYGNGVMRAQVLAAKDALEASLLRFAQRADADLAALLQQELLECVDLYDGLKTRAGALDFLDLLLRARNLVRDCAPVRHAFQQRFKYILVDEFQDTDPLQAEILLLLAGREDSQLPGSRLQAPGSRLQTPGSRLQAPDSRPDQAPGAGQGPGPGARSPEPNWRRVALRKGALFVVGDPKQSIYRFRRADVGIYQEVCDLLEAQGARRVYLRTNFRSVPAIQHAVNAAFAPAMRRDAVSLQADYVPLAPFRERLRLRDEREGSRLQAPGSRPGLAPGARQGPEPGVRSPEPASAGDVLQPAIIALPVPDPYGKRNVTIPAIEASLPDAVGAWIQWLLEESHWKVSERRNGVPELVPVEARHVCILFRRFVKFTDDITRRYVDALEARNIPHLLVGGRSFHDREEVETLRAALAAIEWPDDALNVYATLRGALFALGEEALLEYWHRHPRHRFHPFDVPADLPEHLEPVADALVFLRTLHARRNHCPAAETLGRLLEHTRAHVTFVMRPAGERVLANVLQVVELARQYEADGGISFRGFVDALREAAERSEAPEAPVVEEGSDGVRLMTVHKAKGLEFPVVVLADMTCKLSRADASRHIDAARGLCAMPLIGCTPWDLLDHEAEECARDAAEGIRLAYVAATRARDVLVVPAIGDAPYDGWVGTLNQAIYPEPSKRREAEDAPGCPTFAGKDTVRMRPDDNPGMRGDTVRAGLHVMSAAAPPVGQGLSPASNAVVGQDFSPADVRSGGSGGRTEPAGSGEGPWPLAPSPEPPSFPVVWWATSALSLDSEAPFGLRREDLISKDVNPSVVAGARSRYDAWVMSRTDALGNGSAPSLHVRTITELAHAGAWPASLGVMPPVQVIELPRDGARPKGRRFVTAAATLAARVLAHPLLGAARAADANGKCRREVPVTLTLADGRLLEGVVDLAWEHEGTWTVVDFKTDEDPSRELDAYSRQVGLYAGALNRVCSGSSRGAVLVI